MNPIARISRLVIVVGLSCLATGLATPAAAGLDPGLAGRSLTTEALLDSLQRTAFEYFWEQANPTNGLIRDRSQIWSPCSIAAQGFGITAICIGIDHGWVSREVGRDRILLGMQTLWNGPQGDAASGVNGYRGLFYHFLDIDTGYRTWSCELSTIDTALLMAGILDARQYFDTEDPGDVALRDLADALYLRVDWDFMRSGGGAIRMGWLPGTGFNGFSYWFGYNEAMILYLLALGSPTYPVPEFTWGYWTTGYQWQTQYGYTYVIFPPLFGHQYSHCWVDFRNIWDEYMELRGITYFENSRRATLAQREYCIANPFGWADYGPETWGLTASDDPDGYVAHGAPPAQNDNGTITPTAPASSIPFAPEVVIPTLHNLYDTYGGAIWGQYGFKDAFNPERFWFGQDYIGIDEGPIVIMIENYLNERVWDRFMTNPYVQTGLLRAGFATVTGVPGEFAGDPRLVVDQNAPNPFRETTTVAYRLAEASPATLRLFDLRGRCLQTISQPGAGQGLNRFSIDARGLPSGVYLYSVEAGGNRELKRCIIVR
ncbi:MAG TPA: glucoamylase family protein [Candidatus Krumholzibacteria bacterium]|nr:glucoamylase family protein [Candidatus Krumholzibacteria bacterium]HPD70574.1 glucoamylase family protein [Candidatus Krumholzibacteria bacterium]HRY39726.1 glucoamylase family protein [Candidatus Krumholzibacteria bacterium]